MNHTHVRKNHRVAMPALASLAVAMILGWAVAAQAQQAVHGSGTTNTFLYGPAVRPLATR